MWFICPPASRRFHVGENGYLASEKEMEMRPAGWLIQEKEVSNLGTLDHSTFWLHGVMDDSCPLEIHMDLHVIHQEERRLEHNKDNEYHFSISVLGFVLCALYVCIHIVIAIQWTLDSICSKSNSKKYHYPLVHLKFGLILKDHDVASISETFSLSHLFLLGKSMRHPLSHEIDVRRQYEAREMQDKNEWRCV